MTTDEVPMVRTYPEMNAKIVGILRLMPDEAPMTNLYAAQRIEELEAALARSEQRLRAAVEAEARAEALQQALQWYADPKNWDMDGVCMDNITGGYWIVDEFVDMDYTYDKGARARAALSITPPRAGEGEPPATRADGNVLYMIRDEANLAGLFLANDDGDLAAQHVGNIVRIVGDALTAARTEPPARRMDERERQLREYVSVEAAILRRQYRGRDGHILDAIERLERVVTFQSAGPGDDAGGGTP